MKALTTLALVLVAAPAGAATPVKSLPGVSDKETTIPYTDIRQSVRGHGDVLFVRDRANQWYRLLLNHGCLNTTNDLNGLVFRHGGSSSQIDRFTTIFITGAMRSCAIRSIRRSKAPPQVDSHSPVTLD